MMNMNRILLLVSVAALTATLAQAQSVSLLPAGAGDLVAPGLSERIMAEDWPSQHVETARLSHQRLLTETGPTKPGLYGALSTGPSEPTLDATRVAESRQYWIDASAAELAYGIELPLTAPGAILRISAADGVRLDPSAVRLRFGGREVAAQSLSKAQATGAELRQTGWAVPSNTLAFRLDRTVGAGSLGLMIDGLPAEITALVHVYEPNSPYVARLEVDRQSFIAGQSIEARLALQHGRGSAVPASSSVLLALPDGTSSGFLARRAGSATWSIAAPEQRAAASPGALHELQAHIDTTVDGVRVRRDLSHALAITPALGRLSGSAERSGDSDLALRFGLSTAVEGRFQLRGTLHAHDRRGRLVPVALAESAAILASGAGELALNFDLDAIERAGYRAPFELRDLMLFDQGRMLLLESRQRALVIRGSSD